MSALTVGGCVVSPPAQSWRWPQKDSTLTLLYQYSTNLYNPVSSLLCNRSTTILLYNTNTNSLSQWTPTLSSLKRPSARSLTLSSPRSHWRGFRPLSTVASTAGTAEKALSFSRTTSPSSSATSCSTSSSAHYSTYLVRALTSPSRSATTEPSLESTCRRLSRLYSKPRFLPSFHRHTLPSSPRSTRRLFLLA
jgi:hypothetical protein